MVPRQRAPRPNVLTVPIASRDIAAAHARRMVASRNSASRQARSRNMPRGRRDRRPFSYRAYLRIALVMSTLAGGRGISDAFLCRQYRCLIVKLKTRLRGTRRVTFFLRGAKKRVFHAQRAFVTNPSPEALVEFGFGCPDDMLRFESAESGMAPKPTTQSLDAELDRVVENIGDLTETSVTLIDHVEGLERKIKTHGLRIKVLEQQIARLTRVIKPRPVK
jgi:hypothetical protein